MAWQKGQSGNPNGRAKDKLYRDALIMELKSAGEDMPKLRKIARAHIDKAADGDMTAVKELADRLDGKVPQGITGEDGGPVQVAIREFVLPQ